MRPRSLTALLASLVVLLGPPAVAAPAQATEQVGTRTAGQPAVPTPTSEPARLDAPPTARRVGLPGVLAAVLAGGVVSLLVRLLLAEPAARRRTPGPSVPTGG